MADESYGKQVAIGIGVGIVVAAFVTYLQGDVLFGISVGAALSVAVIAGLLGREIEE
jgi:hypothetical protein